MEWNQRDKERRIEEMEEECAFFFWLVAFCC